MRYISHALALMCLAYAPIAHAACVSPSREVVSVPRYDALSDGVVIENFVVRFEPGDEPSDAVFVQFADRTNAPGEAVADGPGPFAIYALDAASGDLVSGAAPSGLPALIATADGWARVSVDSSRGGMAAFQFRIQQKMATAGVYREALDVRVACRRSDGSFDIQEFPGGLTVRVAVANAVRLASNQAAIDLGELRPTGAGAQGRVDIGLLATGSYEIEIRSANGFQAGRSGGVLIAENAGGETRDQREGIAYDYRLMGVAAENPTRVTCSAGAGPLSLGVQTETAPGAGRLAGIFRDTIEVTVSPRTGSSAPLSGCEAR